ncbi:tail completion protein gp17 [Gemmobacter serpentinus]|uniref:tail completion protein gp17 n=1 Tax=Gemmobacter serpentinus TaxID=2652247 RepID=UPI00124D7A7F|nr:DUF3168 domain-containing protein [Gemmobacter serpentinus]
MLDPSFALQDLIGDTLVADPAITLHVGPLNIRAGSIRPGNTPAIVLAPSQVKFLGHAAGGQIVAEVRVLLHLWTVEDGSTVAQAVAGAMLAALMDAPKAEGFAIDEWDRFIDPAESAQVKPLI